MDRRSFLKILVAAPVALKFASDEMVKEALAMFNPRRVYFDMAVPSVDHSVENIFISHFDADFGWGEAMTVLYPMANQLGVLVGAGSRIVSPHGEARFENGRWDATPNLIVPG